MTQEAKRSNLQVAIDILEDELSGIEGYRPLAGAVDDPELKQLLATRMEDEKKHINMLLKWINQHTQALLSM